MIIILHQDLSLIIIITTYVKKKREYCVDEAAMEK